MVSEQARKLNSRDEVCDNYATAKTFVRQIDRDYKPNLQRKSAVNLKFSDVSSYEAPGLVRLNEAANEGVKADQVGVCDVILKGEGNKVENAHTA